MFRLEEESGHFSAEETSGLMIRPEKKYIKERFSIFLNTRAGSTLFILP
jgi:hypothetical protein